MKISLDKKYQANQFAFPSDNIAQVDKTKPEYFLHCSNSIMSKYVRDKAALPYNKGEGKYSIDELRSFLRGTNSSEKYKDELIGKPKGNSGKRRTNMNISWDVPQILTEKMDVVKGYMMKLAYDVTTTAIDMQAKMDKETIEANMKLMVNDKIKMFGEELNEAAGRQIVENKTQEDIPFQSEKDVTMFSNIGGILLEQEIAFKILLDESLMASDWVGIWDKLIEDLLATSFIGLKGYTDAGSDIAKCRWVDMNRAVFGYSPYNDHRDISWGGEIRQMTIAEIRKESDLSEEQVLEIARLYSKDEKSEQYIGDFYNKAQQGYTNSSFGMNMIDSLVVDVLDSCWAGTYSDKLTKVTRKKEGNLAVNKVDDTYQLSDYAKKNGKELMDHTRQCVYKCKLVMGTDYVFDYGQEFNQTFRKNDQGNMEIIFPYRFLKTGSTSMVERCLGYYDDIAKATYKKRNAINKIVPPPGLYLEKSAFENVEIGKQTISPKQNMEMLQQTGMTVGDTQNTWGQNVVGRSPLTEIPSGSNQQIAIFSQEIEFNIRQIERVTGINEIFSGATPNSEQSVGGAKIAVSATENAIYPLVRTLEIGFEHILRVMAKQWQVSATYMDDKNRTKKAHDRALSYIKISKGLSTSEMLIKIEPGVTDKQKQELLQDIRDLQAFRRQTGTGGIRGSDYVMIYEMINSGQVKQARLVLSQVEEYIKKIDDADKEKLVQMNAQSQMQSNQQTADNESKLTEQEIGLKGQNEVQVIQMKIQGDMMLQKQKSEDDRKLAFIQNLNKQQDQRAAVR